MKKILSLLTASFILFSSILINTTYASNEEKIVSVNNLQIKNGNGALNLTDDISKISSLKEGTIIAKFYKNTSGVMSLIGGSNNKTSSGYITLYVNGNLLGLEIRTQSGSTTTNLDHYNVTKTMNSGMNTVAVKVTNNEGYKLFLNGELIRSINDDSTHFFNSVDGLNSLYVGKTERSTGFGYNFNGDIDFLDIYDKPLLDEDIKRITGATNIGKESQYYPEGVYISDPMELYKSGDLGSGYFRIPSLLTTKKGTVLAGIDVRKGGSHDSPNNIDAGIKRKELGGDWDSGNIIIDYPNNSSVIDMSLLQDDQTERIYLIITHFPNGYGFRNSKTGSGYTTIDNKRYRSLYDKNNTLYTIREDGIVYNSNNEKTNYIVSDNILYENGINKGNILGSSAPLKPYGTSYLISSYSDDDGKTWSKPIDLNKSVKEEWVRFLGAAPGVGIQIKNGEHSGRLVFPVYLTNAPGFQSSAVIYSDDHGLTWSIGETANDGRDMGNGVVGNSETMTSGNQLTENQVVEMPDGQLKLFMRNTGSKVRIATSFDGGATWDNNVPEDTALIEPYCQLSVINYSKEIDGKPALIFSNPKASTRVNGTVRVGLINENGTHENGRTKYEFDWKYDKTIWTGGFSYSCLAELPNGDIGILYEPANANLRSTNYQEMSLDYLKFDLESSVKAPNLLRTEVIDKDLFYGPGEEINIKMTYESPVTIIGNRNITVRLDEVDIELEYFKNENDTTFYYKGVIPESIQKGSNKFVLLGNSNVTVYNLFSKVLTMENDSDLNINGTIKDKEDINNDKLIDILDLSSLAIDYNVSYDNARFDSGKDINRDKFIDLYDLIIVANSINR